MTRISPVFIVVLWIESIYTAPGDLFTFNNGNVGVDFLGFKASAGLGGLLTGNAADGGLHAEAGTPYGQAAKAGLGGSLDGGKSVGGLYADATAGGGVSAGAGLAGHTGAGGSYGKTYAGAAAGGVYKEKTIVHQPALVSTYHAQTVVNKPVEVVETNKEVSLPVVEKHVEIVKEPQPQKTLIERTVIPNYQEKTIYVPSYVEKTIRVPTVVEQKVKVPAPPTVIEKTISAPTSSYNIHTKVEEETKPEVTHVYQKTKIHTHPHVIKHVVEEETEPEVTHVYQKTKIRTHPHFRKHVSWFGGYGGQYGGSAENNAQGGFGSTGTITVRKTVNPQVVNDIFNIPIATLGAVSRLVGGIAGGASGSLEVSKSASFTKY